MSFVYFGVFCFSLSSFQLKRQDKLKEQQRAKDLQDEAIAIIDAREAARVAELEKRSRIIQQKVARMNTFMAKVRDKEAEDLAKALREREEYERQQDALDAKRRADAKRRLEEQHHVLQEQIALKKRLEKKRVQYVATLPAHTHIQQHRRECCYV